MEANSSLLQYYVHRMLREPSPSQYPSSPSSPSKMPPKFRKKTTRSFMIHQYNFLRQQAADDDSHNQNSSPYQQVRDLVRTFDGLNLSVKKYKHCKRSSLQEELQHKLQKQEELHRARLSEMELHNPSQLSVSAVKIGNTNGSLKDRLMRTSMVRRDGEQADVVGTPQELTRHIKKSQLRRIFGLEVRKMELEKQKEKEIEKQKQQHTQKLNHESKPEFVSRTTVMSQEFVRSKRKAIEIRTIPRLEEQSFDTVFQEKARNYRQFLFLIYISNGAFKDIEPCSQKYERKKDVKYQFYVGRGNNCNLIKSIMKKRWWWTISNQITAQTKFVWTQRKINSFIQKQSVIQQYCPVQKKLLQDLPALIQNEAQLRKLLHPKDLAGYKSYAKSLRKQPQSLATRMKIFGKKPIRQIEPQPFVHNHLQSNNYIGNKKALLRNMLNWYKFNKRKHETHNIPRTYHIKSLQDPQFKQFCFAFKQKQKNKNQGNIWIIKPGQNTNRGHGIKVSRNLKNIIGMLQNKNHTYVVQQYITDLFLYNKRKFDIRTYMLITRLAGVMRVYWYSEGYIRTSSEIYQLDDLSNSMIHLTNDAIQKYGDNYGRYEPGNKISYLELQKYLDTYYLAKGYSVAKLVSDMKTITCEAVNACSFKLDPNCRYSNFQIFGLDYIVDSNFKPWLLEVNTNPCLQLSAPLLCRIIPQMVENAFKIGLDPIYPPTACPHNSKPYLSDCVLQKNRFELIFDSQYDRNYEYEGSIPQDQCKYEDDDELFENDGQLVNIED